MWIYLGRPDNSPYTRSPMIGASDPLTRFARRVLRSRSLPVHDRIFATATFSLFFFGIFLFVVDQLLGIPTASWLALSLSGAAAVAIGLIRRRRLLAAKILVHAHVALVICAVNMVFSLGSFILFYTLSVFASLIVVFDRAERKYAIALGSALAVACIWLVLEDPRFMPVELTGPEMTIIRAINVVGALGFTLFQVNHAALENRNYQQRLIALNHEADRYNMLLEANVSERNRLIQMLSHDLRSPFANLLIGLDDAVLQHLSGEERMAVTQRIRADAASTLNMLDGILLWVRSRSGSLKLDVRTIPVRGALEQVFQWLAADAQRKVVRLELQMDQEHTVCADPFALASILRNLMTNALKFTPAGGVVSVDVAGVDGMVRFTVRDTGKGMSPEETANVRARISFSNRGTAQEKGHGVGLLIVQELLDQHGSTLQLSSVVEAGSSFSFDLRSGLPGHFPALKGAA